RGRSTAADRGSARGNRDARARARSPPPCGLRLPPATETSLRRRRDLLRLARARDRRALDRAAPSPHVPVVCRFRSRLAHREVIPPDLRVRETPPDAWERTARLAPTLLAVGIALRRRPFVQRGVSPHEPTRGFPGSLPRARAPERRPRSTDGNAHP